ncbi:hypothetical protein GCM10009069_15760 [Algimonas arctica]|uniref:HTH marR-type domain-containing protein n=1 Tax=Algimonas arctica TaxID=1479486 RepID=A0A8J3CR70_9PROT|nr:MarR family transcriptional regulator [Algimonas arctica]GHA93530.1 hypothetical protein GCM10009069_15760 [Algimonas arctica]
MIGKDKDLLGSLIHDVAHLLRLDIDDRLKVHNLTRVKWLALGVIQDNPHISQSSLATNLELGNATVGRLVDRLVERGFVDRDNDPNDRRSYLLSLTPLAETTIDDLSDVPDALRDDALSGISQDDRTRLSGSLVEMKTNLKERLAALVGGLIMIDHAVPALFQDTITMAASI